mmetsp:Transcript_74569/g.194461  ORF Transcript_74569/g.194461 Transcript_74569/m.194461 type:complete len:222 (-) Transcript_74569:241-906(-)
MIVTFIQEAPSSMAKSTPPSGALNAAATPAAAPAATRSRRSLSNDFGIIRGSEKGRATSEPMMAPLWIMGPSLPAGMPAATLPTMPQTLASSVFTLRTRGKCVPLRKHLISGMPLPAASGSTKQTIVAAIETRARPKHRNAKYCMGSSPSSRSMMCKRSSSNFLQAWSIAAPTSPAPAPASTTSAQRRPALPSVRGQRACRWSASSCASSRPRYCGLSCRS